ncbi:unnamed protein product [Tilletia caries]|nr:unnamed protein product [Tilletia caries]
MWPLLPYSRGSVHASSASTFSNPILDPRYFTVPVDMGMQVAGCRGVRRVLQTRPVADLFAAAAAGGGGEEVPGFEVAKGGVPDGSDHGAYAAWQKWISDNYGSVSHPIVDPTFKVYDTANIRVVDASTLPQQISAHLSSTLYGIAERAADAIKASQ